MYASPFHNLDLLAGVEGDGAPLGARDAVLHALAWRGGPCHVQAAGFASLARALGYEAVLLPATVKEPGDHLVVGIAIDGERWLCDVGNGHPYPEPFPFDRPAESVWLGWHFVTTPSNDALVLERTLPDGACKQVYAARWTPRSYEDFAAVIASHHQRAGFGPFMTGLRAVRFTSRGMLTLRDDQYERHMPFGVSTRTVPDAEACRALLEGPFGLRGAPISQALLGLSRHRDLFPARSGETLGHHAIEGILTVATTDRPRSLDRLLRSLGTAIAADVTLQASATPVALEMIVVENSARAEHRELNRRAVSDACVRGLAVTLVDDGCYGRAIAESRIRQTEVVALRAAGGARPAFVWMLDDDVVFSSLEIRDGEEVEVPIVGVVSRLLAMRAAHPEVSLLIGSVMGDPCVRPEAVLRMQVFDLVENLAWFADLRPDAPYRAPDASSLFSLPDYYYDHSRAGSEHLGRPCPWMPRAAAGTVRQELLTYLEACAGIPSGAHATRPVLARSAPEGEVAVTSAPLRGGNAVFFDLDACLAHPYPTARIGDDLTRRSDMIGSTLLARAGTTLVATAPFALLHARADGQGADDSESRRWRSLRTEFHGVLLARLTMDGCPPATPPDAHLAALAADRAATVVGALRAAGHELTRLDAMVSAAEGWWSRDAEVMRALDVVRGSLREMWDSTVATRDVGDPDEGLARLRERLQDPEDLAAVLTAWEALPLAIERTWERMLLAHREAR
ncbi:MAG: arylamine N-acetyltransferase [Deltaproteobacteria bacterium]|nr:arylamine N-acetyltransferase [Deltaproteobacteria bacterium]